MLHDLATGAMMHLEHFPRALRDEDVEVTQEYRPECAPIADGKILQSIDQFVVQTGV